MGVLPSSIAIWLAKTLLSEGDGLFVLVMVIVVVVVVVVCSWLIVDVT